MPRCDTDLDRAGLDAALDARAELVALVDVEMSTNLPTVRRRTSCGFRAVLGPVGSITPSAGCSVIDEAVLHPEVFQRRPGGVRARLDDQPALAASARDAGVRIGRQHLARARRRARRDCARGGRRLIAIVVVRRRQVGRHLERRRRPCGLVIDRLVLNRFAAGQHGEVTIPAVAERGNSGVRSCVGDSVLSIPGAAQRRGPVRGRRRAAPRQPQFVGDAPHLRERPLGGRRVRPDEERRRSSSAGR